jgi:hypothetical protein
VILTQDASRRVGESNIPEVDATRSLVNESAAQAFTAKAGAVRRAVALSAMYAGLALEHGQEAFARYANMPASAR